MGGGGEGWAAVQSPLSLSSRLNVCVCVLHVDDRASQLPGLSCSAAGVCIITLHGPSCAPVSLPIFCLSLPPSLVALTRFSISLTVMGLIGNHGSRKERVTGRKEAETA